jgi:hypothetical protein
MKVKVQVYQQGLVGHFFQREFLVGARHLPAEAGAPLGLAKHLVGQVSGESSRLTLRRDDNQSRKVPEIQEKGRIGEPHDVAVGK